MCRSGFLNCPTVRWLALEISCRPETLSSSSSVQSDEAHQRKQHTADVLSPALRALEYVAQTDKNVISVGLATDALHRLASGAAAYTDRLAANGVESSSSTAQLAVDARTSCMRVVTAAPVLCWESLCRSTEGMRALRQDWRA